MQAKTPPNNSPLNDLEAVIDEKAIKTWIAMFTEVMDQAGRMRIPMPYLEAMLRDCLGQIEARRLMPMIKQALSAE
jgi:hypothetical protein